jgi:hypothetical protein
MVESDVPQALLLVALHLSHAGLAEAPLLLVVLQTGAADAAAAASTPD